MENYGGLEEIYETKKHHISKNTKEFHSILSRLPSANPDLKWNISTLGHSTPSYINLFNLSKKWAMITDPYNPCARRSGLLIFYL
jgi:hypothetical protein